MKIVHSLYNFYHAQLKKRKSLKILSDMKEHQLKNYALYCENPFTIIQSEKIFDYSFKDLNYSTNKTVIQHRTNYIRAQSIIKTQLMYGTDANQGAHFEHLKGSLNHADRSSVIIFFEWKGEQNNVPSFHKAKKDILFHVSVYDHTPIGEKGVGYWESRIYPYTSDGLTIIGLASENEPKNLLLFKNPIKVSIVTEDEFFSRHRFNKYIH
ncbi:hypothetical protein [Sulfurimonas microaerophilic]|uniref:hypothetical protein n=1 Tax=Sulfurimonas microaerophilic TaxID=3058392 RepID=UPI002714AD37|nr:hypothetical protein [Sulfurimonas sp. hsl 1-7]